MFSVCANIVGTIDSSTGYKMQPTVRNNRTLETVTNCHQLYETIVQLKSSEKNQKSSEIIKTFLRTYAIINV